MQVTLVKGPKGSKGGRPTVMREGESIPSSENSKCKGPEVKECLAYCRRLRWSEGVW